MLERFTVWDTLAQRPLRLPRMEPGEACRRTHARRVHPHWGIALDGGEPPYPLPFPTGAIDQTRSDGARNGWRFHKTIWLGPPGFFGPVLVRGRQLDGQDEVRFAYALTDPPPVRELRLEFVLENLDQWRQGVGMRYTLVRRSGCYAFQVDGVDFSRTLIFETAERDGVPTR